MAFRIRRFWERTTHGPTLREGIFFIEATPEMSESKHILGVFENALEDLRHEVFRMASLAQQNLGFAMRGLLQRNTDLCNKVIADDEEIDQLEKEIDHDGLTVMLRFQPVASDLRQVISSMKMSNNLERISDHAVNISKRGKRMNRHPELAEVKLVEPLHDLASNLVADAVHAFQKGDIELSLQVIERDKELDRAHKHLIKRLTTKSEENPERIEDYIDLIFVVRFLERVGDHAVNICEDCVYTYAATDIRHGGTVPLRTHASTPPGNAANETDHPASGAPEDEGGAAGRS